MKDKNYIIVKGARVNNLKNIDVKIPKDKLVVITGLSGSGKSSLAFDTIYAEGQRRYIESLSSYARQFLGVLEKPEVDSIKNLPPAIAIDQRSISRNPRSTVGTLTEIYDYFRLLFAKVGEPHCPRCGEKISPQTVEQILAKILDLAKRSSNDFFILAPLVRGKRGEHKNILRELEKNNFRTVRWDRKFYSLEEAFDLSVDKDKKHTLEVVVDKIKNEELKKFLTNKKQNFFYIRLLENLKRALDLGKGFILLIEDSSVEESKNLEISFSEYSTCFDCEINLPPIEPRLFSFNSPYGACSSCSGLGVKLAIDSRLLVPNPRLTLAEGAIKIWLKIFANQKEYWRLLEEVAARHKFSVDTPIEKLTPEQKEIILKGEKKSKSEERKVFKGIINILEEKYKETSSDYIRQEIEKYMESSPCPSCRGRRLKEEVLAVKIRDLAIDQIAAKTVDEAIDFFKEFDGMRVFSKKIKQLITQKIAKEILSRLSYLKEVGLGYLALDRSAVTLSGGEAQRIRLATQISSSLAGVVYILDEPSIGLHPRDSEKLLKILKTLCDLGNSVLVVEHDAVFIKSADYLIDMGPDAGEYGGRIVAEGMPSKIKKCKNSLTGQYLAGHFRIMKPQKYHQGSGKFLVIKKAKEFNLKNIDVRIPLGKLVAVTGVSGSGKSTLIIEILAKALARKFNHAKDLPGAHEIILGLEHLDKVISIDQSPIGRTPRSNPATYTGLFNHIRDLFADLPEAKMRGYKVGNFSFNVKEGRCEACSGEGLVKIEMQFLPDVYAECEECKGRRYHREILEIHYQGKNIAGILAMTVEEANWFFNDKKTPLIIEKLKILHQVGLGYLHLGQSATTLSGGEAQRVKLATELSRRDTGRTLYILDEPTTGLHVADIKRLLEVLNQLVDKGNTVLVIEHNLEVIKSADWIIDLGPEGGEGGGYIIAEGTPEEIVREKKSYTGKYLKRELVENLKNKRQKSK